MSKKITELILTFPHGASISDCQDIIQKAEKFVKAGVSEGGMLVTNRYGLNVETVTFSEDTMHYIFGHDKTKDKISKEKCMSCGRSDFAIARDMIATRLCKCGATWVPK